MKWQDVAICLLLGGLLQGALTAAVLVAALPLIRVRSWRAYRGFAGDAGKGGHDMYRKPADPTSWLCFLVLLATLAAAEGLCAALAYDTLGEVSGPSHS